MARICSRTLPSNALARLRDVRAELAPLFAAIVLRECDEPFELIEQEVLYLGARLASHFERWLRAHGYGPDAINFASVVPDYAFVVLLGGFPRRGSFDGVSYELTCRILAAISHAAPRSVLLEASTALELFHQFLDAHGLSGGGGDAMRTIRRGLRTIGWDRRA